MATIRALGPVDVRTTTNQFVNPSFETDEAWLESGSVSAVNRSVTGVIQPDFSAFIIANSAPTSAFTGVGQAADAIAEGEWFAARIPVRPSGTTPAPRARVQVSFYDAGGVFVSGSSSIIEPTPAFNFTTLTHAAQAPAGAATVRAYLLLAGATTDVPDPDTAASTDTWIGATEATEAAARAAVATYFDGDTPGAHWNGVPHASSSSLDYVIAPELVLDYGYTRGSRNVVLEPLGSGYPTVFLRGAQSKAGTLKLLFKGAAPARTAADVLSTINQFHFQELAVGEDFQFIVTGPVTVRNEPGTPYWTVDAEFREVEPR